MDKQPAYCPLLAEGYTNKIKENSGIQFRRFYRSFPRLLVFGNVARVVWWEGSRFEAAGGDLERFLTEKGPRNILFPSEVSNLFVLRSIGVSPQPS